MGNLNLNGIPKDVLIKMNKEAADAYGLALIAYTKSPTIDNESAMNKYKNIVDQISKELS